MNATLSFISKNISLHCRGLRKASFKVLHRFGAQFNVHVVHRDPPHPYNRRHVPFWSTQEFNVAYSVVAYVEASSRAR